MKEQIPFQVIGATENLFPRIISEKKHFREVLNSRRDGENERWSVVSQQVGLCVIEGEKRTGLSL